MASFIEQPLSGRLAGQIEKPIEIRRIAPPPFDDTGEDELEDEGLMLTPDAVQAEFREEVVTTDFPHFVGRRKPSDVTDFEIRNTIRKVLFHVLTKIALENRYQNGFSSTWACARGTVRELSSRDESGKPCKAGASRYS